MHNKTSMTTRKITWTPTTIEAKINHALASSFAFNLKLCLMLFAISLWCSQDHQIQSLGFQGQSGGCKEKPSPGNCVSAFLIYGFIVGKFPD